MIISHVADEDIGAQNCQSILSKGSQVGNGRARTWIHMNLTPKRTHPNIQQCCDSKRSLKQHWGLDFFLLHCFVFWNSVLWLRKEKGFQERLLFSEEKEKWFNGFFSVGCLWITHKWLCSYPDSTCKDWEWSLSYYTGNFCSPIILNDDSLSSNIQHLEDSL